MLFTVTPNTPSSSDMLQEITTSFFAALNRDGGPVFAVVFVLVVLVLAVSLMSWLRREIRRERIERAMLDARHMSATAGATTSCKENRQSVRVPAHVPMTLRRGDGRGHVVYETCETQNISGDAVAFMSHTSPPCGLLVDFTIDLGEKRPVALRGAIRRVDAPRSPGDPALVVVALGPLSPSERQNMTRWVAHEETRALAERSRGRLCTVCSRPLAADVDTVHPACARAASGICDRSPRSPRR